MQLFDKWCENVGCECVEEAPASGSAYFKALEVDVTFNNEVPATSGYGALVGNNPSDHLIYGNLGDSLTGHSLPEGLFPNFNSNQEHVTPVGSYYVSGGTIKLETMSPITGRLHKYIWGIFIPVAGA